MRDSIAVRKWLDIAASGVKFGPDREAVKAELLEHIEDKTADLMRIFPDMEEKEAQERALAGMGNAEELKVSLAKVHRPWLGYLWRATQVLVWTALALVLIAGLDGGSDFLQNQWYSWQEAQGTRAASRALYEDGVPDWEGERLAVYPVNGEARLGRSTVSVSRAARWREPEGEYLYLQVRITWDRPWETNLMVLGYLWVEDDLGNLYSRDGSWSISARGLERWSPFSYQINLRLKDTPPEARQLRLHYMGGTDLDLAVDLTREVAP